MRLNNKYSRQLELS